MGRDLPDQLAGAVLGNLVDRLGDVCKYQKIFLVPFLSGTY